LKATQGTGCTSRLTLARKQRTYLRDDHHHSA
jgi:hypothetical protein